MFKISSIVGFAAILAIILLVLAGRPEASGGEAQIGVALNNDCNTREVALDEGYGVTRLETQVVCAEENRHCKDLPKFAMLHWAWRATRHKR